MMKYTDRKKTPLKWHHTVVYLLQPLFLIITAYLLLCMINELFGLHISALPAVFAPLLAYVNPSLSITNLGSMFWPVTGTFFVTILFLIAAVYVWIGFLKWKKQAENLWLLWLLIRTAALIGTSVLLLMRSDILRALRTFAVFDSMGRSLLHVLYALFVMFCLWNLIFLILNFIYYHKRKLLFQPDYIQPSEKPEADEEPVPVEDHSGKKETEETEKHSPGEQQKEESSEETENHPEDAVTEDNQEEERIQTEQPGENPVPDTGENADAEKNPVYDPDHSYCPYCGARLGKYDVSYCSHCGRKLS